MRTPYERALASLTRREFLNIAWKLGASAALLPLSSQQEQGYFTAYRHMANENFDAIFHTGDYIYEYAAYAGASSRVRKHLGWVVRVSRYYW